MKMLLRVNIQIYQIIARKPIIQKEVDDDDDKGKTAKPAAGAAAGKGGAAAGKTGAAAAGKGGAAGGQAKKK